MRLDVVHKVAKGRIWTGQDAFQLGLVDELGGLTRAIALAKQLAHLPQVIYIGVSACQCNLHVLRYIPSSPLSCYQRLSHSGLSPHALRDLVVHDAYKPITSKSATTH